MSQWQYFSQEELECPHCQKCPMDANFMARLVAVRRELGFPLNINSGYRCSVHNKNVGGKAASKHLLGRAVDIKLDMSEENQIRLLSSLIDHGLHGIGVAKTFIHADDYSKRLWSY